MGWHVIFCFCISNIFLKIAYDIKKNGASWERGQVLYIGEIKNILVKCKNIYGEIKYIVRGLYWFPLAAITNFPNFSDLKKHKYSTL